MRRGGPCTAALAWDVPVASIVGPYNRGAIELAMITLALSKGRIFEETLPLLGAAGIEVLEDPEKSRKLILPTNHEDVRVVLVRASDVPTYVQYGGADMGVCGKDTLLEHRAEWGGAARSGLFQPLDLRIARCRVSVAVRADFDYQQAVRQGSRWFFPADTQRPAAGTSHDVPGHGGTSQDVAGRPTAPAADYTHYAFTVEAAHFAALVERLRAGGVQEWRDNRSEGASFYFLDPDGHKLAVHVGDLASRLRQCRAAPYAGMRFFDV